VGTSTAPVFYFDPTDDRRIFEQLIPKVDSGDDVFPSGRYHFDMSKVAETRKEAASHRNHQPIPWTIQQEYGSDLKKAYPDFVNVQPDGKSKNPSCFEDWDEVWASSSSMKNMDAWFFQIVRGLQIPLGVIEFKASYLSTAEALPQAFAYAASIAKYLWDQDVPASKVLVPIMVGNGMQVQFGCMFVHDGFPIPITTSCVIDVLTTSGRRTADSYMRLIRSCVFQIAQTLREGVAGRNGYKFSNCVPASIHIKFGYVTQAWEENDLEGSARHVLEILSMLWLTPAWDYVCPPLGYSTKLLPGYEGRSEGFFFQDLTKLGFVNELPPFDLADQFINELDEAVKRLHDEGVVHGDLYPTNVFWKMSSGHKMEIRIIDWDTAFRVNENLPLHIVNVWEKCPKWMAYDKDNQATLDIFMLNVYRYAALTGQWWTGCNEADNDAFRDCQRKYNLQ